MNKADYKITFKLFKDNTKKKYREYRLFINDIETIYTVRGDGNVYSTNYRHTNKTKKIKPTHNRYGYMLVHLSINGKDYTISVHKLVAIAFIDNPNNLPEVNHKDLNKENNCYKNLEWIDHDDNVRHAVKNNAIGYRKCEEHANAKLTNKKVHKICKMLEKNKSMKDICDKLNVSIHTVYAILHKREWTEISDQYNFENHTARGNAKLTEKDVHKICKLYSTTDMSMADIARKFGVKKEAVQLIIRGKNWKKISSQYTFTR